MNNNTKQSPSETNLELLIDQFDLINLGDGCAETGLSLFGCMLLSLSNLAHPESGLSIEGGRKLGIRTNLLVSGPTLSHQTQTDIIQPLSDAQNRFSSHLMQVIRQLQKPPAPGELTNSLQPWLHNNESDYQNLIPLIFADSDSASVHVSKTSWRQLLESPAATSLEDVVLAPLVFISACDMNQLAVLLEKSHLGDPCIHVAINDTKDFTRYARLLPSILDGCHRSKSGTCSITGKLLLTDWYSQLDSLLQDGKAEAAWIGRSVWLIESRDGSSSFHCVQPGRRTEKPPLDRIRDRFQLAMISIMTDRLNAGVQLSNANAPKTHRLNVENSLKRYLEWTNFLRQHETQFPGITAAASNLWAGLHFGLEELSKASPIPKNFSYNPHGIFALSCWIVGRMVKHRQSIMQDEDDLRRKRILDKLLNKLSCGTFSTRELYRALSVPADDCRHALSLLEADSVIVCHDDYWQLNNTQNN